MNQTANELIAMPTAETAADEAAEGTVETGWWYWLHEGDEKRTPVVACVTHIGSNYVELSTAFDQEWRIHFKDFHAECRRELNPAAVIGDNIARCQQLVLVAMAEIREITNRLGVGPQQRLTAPGEATTTALSVVSGTDNVVRYKNELIAAKDKQLPELFETIADAHKELAAWMTAETLPLVASVGEMKGYVGQINDRISTVELYAGLVEEVTQVRKGQPAAISDKLHLMQRMCFMDEECIAGYTAGGIEFKTIEKFDRWLAKKANFARIFPFPRCVVAFQVRRKRAERDWEGSLSKLLLNISLENDDKATFLYIRNGEQLHRLSTEIEFGHKLFPDIKEFDLTQKLWARQFCSSVSDLITDADYQERVAAELKREQLYKKWKKANPKAHYFDNPHRDSGFNGQEWHPFDQTSVYFDDTKAKVEEQIRDYNRIAIIVQGLFDRSPVLHPHPPVQLWSPGGFEDAIKLIYDKDRTLHYGDPPDFEAYRAQCNTSLMTGSITVGQEDFWELLEGIRETNRMDNRRYSGDYRPMRHRPYGNPGPGFLAEIAEWHPRRQKATFRWSRTRQSWKRWSENGPLPTSLVVPSKKLFNVNAYTPGDFKQFYADPRTRADYLQWASLLLAAEEYHAGNLKVGCDKNEE